MADNAPIFQCLNKYEINEASIGIQEGNWTSMSHIYIPETEVQYLLNEQRLNLNNLTLSLT